MGIFVCLLILFVYIIRPGDWVPGLDLRWNLILNVVGVTVLFALVIAGKAKKSWDKTGNYLLAFFGLMIASSIVMQQISTVPLYAPQMLTNILVFSLICISVQNERQLNTVITAFVALALFVAYQCYLQISTGFNFAGIEPLTRGVDVVGEDGFATRGKTLQALWVGVFNDPNDVGLLFVTLLPLAAMRTLYGPRSKLARLYWGVSTVALCYGVVLTNSRGTFLALLAGIGYFFILRYRSLKGLVAAAIGAGLLITVGPSRMTSITSGDDAAMERVYAWIEALFAFSLYPVFGLGPKHWMDWHHKTTHNSFVLAFVESGFVAYVCWLAVILIPLYLVSRAAFQSDDTAVRNEYAIFGACMAGVITSIFFISRTYVLIPYFISACALTHCRISNRKQYLANLSDMTAIRLGAIAAASIVMIWVTNVLTTRLMI